jgi:DNA sulfur modification protein DndC
MDLNTPSCGGSRFGCWVCTVVKTDKSMEGFIQSGEDWMIPLAEFRDWLKEYRERDGVRMTVRRDGSKGPGPFTAAARREILQELLEREAEVGVTLISDEEIRFIQTVWSGEFDLESSAVKMARRFGRGFAEGESVPLREDDRALLDDAAAEREINPALVAGVLALEADFPDLNTWGAKVALKTNLQELIVAAAGAEA